MGIVYKARDPFIDRIVAIKTIHLDSQIEEEDLAARLEMEAKSAGRLQHPNICTVFDFGKEENLSFIVIEFAEGSDLQELIDSKAPISLPQKLDLIVQVAHGLNYAHEMGVVHRDMKPANIRVTKKGTAKIIDFGLARFDTTRLTRTGFVSGTVAYMSPERFSGQSGPSDDIFALGAVAYEILTYQRAYPGSSPPEVMMKIISGEPPAPSSIAELPEILDPILRKCMARDVVDRYKSAAEFASDLEDLYTAEAYQAFLQSPDRSEQFSRAVADWVAATTLASSGRNRLRAAGVPTVVIERGSVSSGDPTGETTIQRREPPKPTEIVATSDRLPAATPTIAETDVRTESDRPIDHSGSSQTIESPRDEHAASPTLMATADAPAPASPKTVVEAPSQRTRSPLIWLVAIIGLVGLVILGLMSLGGGSTEQAGTRPLLEQPTDEEQPTTVSETLPREEPSVELPPQVAVLTALLDETRNLQLNDSERVRLREIESMGQRGRSQIESGNDSDGVATLETSINQLRELVASHEQRIASELRRPEPPAPTPSTRRDPEPRPPTVVAERPVTSPPPTNTAPPEPEPVRPVTDQPTPTTPSRTDAEARSEIRSFIEAVARAYQERNVGFFRSRYAGYNETVANAIRNSPSAGVSISIESINLNGTERATVNVTRTDTFSDSRIPAGTQKLTYQLRRDDEQWILVSFSRR